MKNATLRRSPAFPVDAATDLFEPESLNRTLTAEDGDKNDCDCGSAGKIQGNADAACKDGASICQPKHGSVSE